MIAFESSSSAHERPVDRLMRFGHGRRAQRARTRFDSARSSVRRASVLAKNALGATTQVSALLRISGIPWPVNCALTALCASRCVREHDQIRRCEQWRECLIAYVVEHTSHASAQVQFIDRGLVRIPVAPGPSGDEQPDLN